MAADGINFDVFESLFLMNESLHKADLYLNALSTHGNFDPAKVRCLSESLRTVRATTNAYVMGIIQKVESEFGVSA